MARKPHREPAQNTPSNSSLEEPYGQITSNSFARL
jgi:hypothetical protein